MVLIGQLAGADGYDWIRNTSALSMDCSLVVLIGHLLPMGVTWFVTKLSRGCLTVALIGLLSVA